VTTAYDLIPYPSGVSGRTHPAVFAAFAALFGKPFAPFGAARLLEIGCGNGVSLINMALCAPGSEFVGVDLAETPINQARATAEAVGVGNVRFHVQDLTDIEDSLGVFDYVVAHGVYAWVARETRQALMRVMAKSLSPVGLAFVSYNAYPGGHFRQILRDLLLSATDDVVDPAEKLRTAHAVLAQAADAWSASDPFQNALRTAAEGMLAKRAEVVFHDELGAHFEPQLLSEVIAAARNVGLEYLCDSNPPMCAEAFFPSEIFAAAQPYSHGDWGRFEQLMDFRDVRFFRNSIFCRGGGIDRRIEPRRLRGLWAYGAPKPLERDQEAPEEFAFAVGQGGKVTTNSVRLADLITRIGAAFPQCTPLDEAADDPDLAAQTLRLFVGNVIRLRTAPYSFTLTPGDRPLASPLARLQAKRGEQILTSLNNSSVAMDPSGRELLGLLDGTRTRDEFAREAAARAKVPLTDEIEAKALSTIEEMARWGLMAA
jgi:SAM-dependent methyltransferase